MASSSSHASSRRFYDCLNGLQEEFERRSNGASTKESGSRRFNIYLGNLRGEFELMSLEIETLREERDEYKGKSKMQKLKDVGHAFVCKRCNMESMSGAQIAVPSKPDTSSSCKPFFQFKSLTGVDLIPEATSCRPSHRMTLMQKLRSIITSPRSSQSVSHAVNNSIDLSSPLCDPDLDPEERNCLIEFNNKVEKKLDVEIAHSIFHEERIRCVKFSRDGKYLAVGCFDGKAYIYDVESGTLTRVLKNLLEKDNPIKSVCFSHDGKYLATGSWIGSLYIWEIDTKYVRNAFKGHTHGCCINSLDFSPNGRLVVSASTDNTVRLWNMRDGATKLLAEENPTILDNPCYSYGVFSPDGMYVAAAHRDGIVRIWSVLTGQLLRRVKAGRAWVTCVAFMPNGEGLVTGGGDGKVRYWGVRSFSSTQIRTRSELQMMKDSSREPDEEICVEQEFTGHKSHVYFLDISPDGGWMASCSHDKSVRIWDTGSAAMQCSLTHDEPVWTVAFSPVGHRLAFVEAGGKLRIWRYSNIASRAQRGNKLCKLPS